MTSNLVCSNLTDYQLFELKRNESLDKAIRKAAAAELERRKLAPEQVQHLVSKYDARFPSNKNEGLPVYFKIFLIICPFFIEVYSLFAGRMLAKGQQRKWKDYLLYICIGYMFWTVCILLYANYMSTTLH